jgi:hypothetical protein
MPYLNVTRKLSAGGWLALALAGATRLRRVPREERSDRLRHGHVAKA